MSRMLQLAAVTLALGVALAACGRQDRTEDVASDPYPDTTGGLAPGDPRVADATLTPDQTQPTSTPPSHADTGTVAHGSRPVAGNRDQVRLQLRAEGSRLDLMVKGGRLPEAVTSATRIRDLAVALGGKTTGLPAANIRQIEGDVHAVTEIVEQLRIQAQAGSVDGVKAQNDLLQPVLARLVRLSTA